MNQEQQRKKWREYYSKNKEKYKVWNKNWRKKKLLSNKVK